MCTRFPIYLWQLVAQAQRPAVCPEVAVPGCGGGGGGLYSRVRFSIRPADTPGRPGRRSP